MELVPDAVRVHRIIVVDRVVGKLFPPNRSAVHDHIVRKINSRGIGDAAELKERIRVGAGRTYRAVVDVRPGVRKVRDTLAAEIAGVPREAGCPLAGVNVGATPAPRGAVAAVEVEAPLVGVLEAKAEREWIRRASPPASDRSAHSPARTVGVLGAGRAV